MICLIFVSSLPSMGQETTKDDYLSTVKGELKKEWPHNRTINLVFHGHSVPTGYFQTPTVNTLGAYPHLTLKALKVKYNSAVVNAITTSIGGENAQQGAKRFKEEVLTMRPDILFIDYALNDRYIGLNESRKAWSMMIEEALQYGCKIILLTPTPDTTEDILDNNSPLAKHAEQIRKLAKFYHVGLVDSYAEFKRIKNNGESLNDYMSQNNHPNEKGHQVVADSIIQSLFRE